MVAKRWRPLAERLDDGFDAYEADQGLLPGLTLQRRASLIRQLVDSCRVNSYLEHLRTQPLSQQAADPSDEWFNPVKAAVIHLRQGEDDEAFWLVSCALISASTAVPGGRTHARCTAGAAQVAPGPGSG